MKDCNFNLIHTAKDPHLSSITTEKHNITSKKKSKNQEYAANTMIQTDSKDKSAERFMI